MAGGAGGVVQELDGCGVSEVERRLFVGDHLAEFGDVLLDAGDPLSQEPWSEWSG